MSKLKKLPYGQADYKNIEDLNKFLIYYNTNRKHGGLKKELKVRTPYEAIKSWFDVEPQILRFHLMSFMLLL